VPMVKALAKDGNSRDRCNCRATSSLTSTRRMLGPEEETEFGASICSALGPDCGIHAGHVLHPVRGSKSNGHHRRVRRPGAVAGWASPGRAERGRCGMLFLLYLQEQSRRGVNPPRNSPKVAGQHRPCQCTRHWSTKSLADSMPPRTVFDTTIPAPSDSPVDIDLAMTEAPLAIHLA